MKGDFSALQSRVLKSFLKRSLTVIVVTDTELLTAEIQLNLIQTDPLSPELQTRVSTDGSEAHQRSQVDCSLLKMCLHQRWCVPLLNKTVVQCKAAEVAIHLQRHCVPISIIDAMTREAQRVRTGTASPETTGQLEPQLPLHQLQQHKHTKQTLW